MAKRIAWVLLLVGMLLVGCGGAQVVPDTAPLPTFTPEPVFEAVSPTTPSGPPDVVRVAYEPTLAFAALYVAIERGYFRAQNLDVRPVVAMTDTEAAGAVTGREADVGAVEASAALFNAASTGDLRIVATAAILPPANGPAKLEVRRVLADAGIIRSAADLKGRKIAVVGGAGSNGAYLTAKVLQAAGVNIRDVSLIAVAAGDMLFAMTTGTVDAALIPTPYATFAVDMGIGRVLADSPAPGASRAVYVYSGGFAGRVDVARRFTIALQRGQAAIQGDGYRADDHIRAYQKYVGGAEKLVRDTPPLVYDAALPLARESVRDQERVCRESGWAAYARPLDLDRLFAPEFVAYARAAS